MLGFELRVSNEGSNRSTNWATTTPLMVSLFLKGWMTEGFVVVTEPEPKFWGSVGTVVASGIKDQRFESHNHLQASIVFY